MPRYCLLGKELLGKLRQHSQSWQILSLNMPNCEKFMSNWIRICQIQKSSVVEMRLRNALYFQP